MELWDIYDANRIRTDELMVRGEVMKEGHFHLVVHVCIFNTEGKMLIQKRQSYKEGWPDRWDLTVGGSAVNGENSQAAAERELFEELGISVSLKNVRPHMTINFERGFDDYYLIEKDVVLSSLKLQEEEVQDARWAGRSEILEMIRSGEFIPYYESLISFMFDQRKHYGSLDRNK
ncbi:MAG TPA: NUDIX hydrolase [Clostridiaceae bacterium]|nr:NUDIX hydrolase [Clostridiaceae bacterium]